MKEEKAAEHLVWARKYRPLTFDDVVGQDAVTVTLKNALAAGKLAHAFLFIGPRGVGKTTTARILAKALNCVKGPTPEPCLKCDPCREIADSSALDVLEMDAASNTSVDNVREAIVETVALAPSRDRRKVFIIDEAHMLSTAAFNALLKTLEEPPPHVVFVLATTEANKVPATIVSRCQRFRFRPVDAPALAAHLKELAKKERVEAEPAALDLLARAAGGSLRDSVGLLEQAHTFGGGKVTEELARGMLGFVPVELLRGLAQGLIGKDAKALARWLKTAYDEGLEPWQLLRDLREALEPIYAAKLGAGSTLDPAWAAEAAALTAESSGFLLRRINRILEELRSSDSPRLTLELGLFGCLEAAYDLSALVGRLEALERRLGQGEGEGLGRPSGALKSARRDESPAEAEKESPWVAEIWARLLAALHDRVTLSECLEKAQVAALSAGEWRARFPREFELKAVERQLSVVEANLATLAGRPVKLRLELGARAEPEDAMGPALAASAEAPPVAGEAGAGWHDVTEGASGHPLKKAEKILGGTVRVVKKK